MTSKAERAWGAHQVAIGNRLREYRDMWQCLPALIIEPTKNAAELIDQLLPPQAIRS